MKVLFLSRYQFPYTTSGGTGVVVYELMQSLLELGIDIQHWTWPIVKNSLAKDELENIKEFVPVYKTSISNTKLSKFFDTILTNLEMINSYSELKKFDLIHVHTWEMFIVGIIAKYLWKRPLIFTTHDIMVGDRPGEVHSTDIYEFSVQAERILTEESDLIINVSEDNNALFERLYPNTIGRCETIPNGVNLESFQKKTTHEVFNKHKIELISPYILFLGRASKQKGLHYLLDAIKYLPNEIPIIFALSTKRWDGESYEPASSYINRINKLKEIRKKTYTVLNEWDRCMLSELYSFAKFTVMPSIYEPCGMVALESQACGSPVLANRIGFMKDCITNNETGILIDFYDDPQEYPKDLAKNILNLWNNVELLHIMKEKTRNNVVENHSWKFRAITHIQHYSKCLQVQQNHVSPNDSWQQMGFF